MCLKGINYSKNKLWEKKENKKDENQTKQEEINNQRQEREERIEKVKIGNVMRWNGNRKNKMKRITERKKKACRVKSK